MRKFINRIKFNLTVCGVFTERFWLYLLADYSVYFKKKAYLWDIANITEEIDEIKALGHSAAYTKDILANLVKEYEDYKKNKK